MCHLSVRVTCQYVSPVSVSACELHPDEFVCCVPQKFVQTDPSPRRDATVIQVKEGSEPASFKALFPSWDDNLFEVPDSVRAPLSMAGGTCDA